MLEWTIIIGISAAVPLAAAHWIFQRRWAVRVACLEKDLRRFSDAMVQMADLQLRAHRKVSTNLGSVEERLLDLAVPGGDSRMPLERRHRVLSMAGKGVAVEDIARKLSLPRGEAELIVNLRRYAAGARPQKVNGEARRHV